MTEKHEQIILKNGWRFQGRVLEETDDKLILYDRKNGRMQIDKTSISARWELKRWFRE